MGTNAGPAQSSHQRPPIDPWCDDGSVSRAEPPWLRDKRLQKQRERLQQQKDRLNGMKSTNNPFEETTNNPFDSSSYSDSSSSRALPVTPVEENQQTEIKRSAFSPFSYPVPPYRVEKNLNPFDSGSSASESRQPPRIVRPTVSRPLQKNPKRLAYTDESVQDSLDQFLDTTDETAASSTQDEEERRSSEDSGRSSTTPSEKALQAAEALRQSFDQRKRKNSSERVPFTPSPRQTPAFTPLSTPQQQEKPISRSPATAGESRRRARQIDSLSRQPRSPEDFPSLQSKARATVTPEPASLVEPTSITPKSDDTELNLALHDLCDEARTTDDIAWRNALFLLSVEPHVASQVEPECRMTALHTCCMSLDVEQPAPVWMIRALLYTDPYQCQMQDSGGRLPLHLLAATSGNVDLMQLLVEEYPASVAHQDSRGFTPLCLLLKNDQVALTLEHMRILLGQTCRAEKQDKKSRILFRKGDHLKESFDNLFQDLQDLQTKQQATHEKVFETYPDDVQQRIQKITQWKRRQINRGLQPQSTQLALVYHNPAAMATPTARQLPLHLLVRRQPPTTLNEIGAAKLASHETLLRVLIAAYPEALTTTDANGRTPLLTALLQSESLPNTETVELLLGKYTPGISDPHNSPAQLPSMDTLQLPLHVAAEELAYNFEVLSTIAEAYPQAVHVQDIRGRTPLHCALQNYRSVPLDEATFHLLLMSRNYDVEQVAKSCDSDGKRPLDLILEHPSALQRWPIEDTDDVICGFLKASLDTPRNDRQARDLLERIRALPSWLRRPACASSHVQRALLEELANPINTALVLLQGAALVSLLIVLRIALEGSGIDFDSWILVKYFSAYHLSTQILYWGIAWYLGEFYRMVLANGWRWIDFCGVCCSIGVATAVQADITSLRESLDTTWGNFNNFIPADEDALISTLGGWATGLLYASLVGFLAQWWCGMAVFAGSAVQIIRVMFWPTFIGAMGIVGMSQVLKTLEDCLQGNICGVADAYTTVYWLILGEPILGISEVSMFEKEMTTSMLVLLIFFTLLWLFWLLSVIAITVSEAHRLDRDQIALQWFWEPKVALTLSTRRETLEGQTPIQRYCDFMELVWHVLTSSIRGGIAKEEIYWHAWCFRPGIIIGTRVVACIVLPIWFWFGIFSLGLLWPPQLRRWFFSTKFVHNGKKPKGPMEERMTAAKLSHLKGKMEEYQTRSMDQNYAIQEDLAQIKELLFRVMLEEVPS